MNPDLPYPENKRRTSVRYCVEIGIRGAWKVYGSYEELSDAEWMQKFQSVLKGRLARVIKSEITEL